MALLPQLITLTGVCGVLSTVTIIAGAFAAVACTDTNKLNTAINNTVTSFIYFSFHQDNEVLQHAHYPTKGILYTGSYGYENIT